MDARMTMHFPSLGDDGNDPACVSFTQTARRHGVLDRAEPAPMLPHPLPAFQCLIVGHLAFQSPIIHPRPHDTFPTVSRQYPKAISVMAKVARVTK